MTLQQSYADVLEVAKKVGVDVAEVKEEAGKLVVKATAHYGYERDQMWDQIKTHPNWSQEIMVLLNVKDESIYGIYTVAAGDTLGKIARRFYGDAKKYVQIYEANRDTITDPDVIKVGQKIRLPTKSALGVA